MRKAKDTLLSATSPRLTQRAKEISSQRDKRAFVGELASETVKAASKRDLNSVHKITK